MQHVGCWTHVAIQLGQSGDHVDHKRLVLVILEIGFECQDTLAYVIEQTG